MNRYRTVVETGCNGCSSSQRLIETWIFLREIAAHDDRPTRRSASRPPAGGQQFVRAAMRRVSESVDYWREFRGLSGSDKDLSDQANFLAA
jgi:hypothetical protein